MNSYNENLYSLLKTLDVTKDNVDYNNSFGIKCPYCGHTDNSPNSTHMWIKFLDDDQFPIFHCVKCDNGGIVTPKLINDLGLYDTDLQYNFSQLKIKNSKKIGIIGNKKNKLKKLKLLPPLNIPQTINKIKYFEDRMGIKLSANDLSRFKIIFNIYDFLNYNEINNLTRNKKIVDSLDEKYIGFMSCNNELISFRNITNEYNKYEKRYIIYNIFNLENTIKLYSIKMHNKINIMKRVKVIMAEGTFDIIGVYKHIYDKEPKNSIFIAVLGMGYASVIKYLNTMGIIFADYIIYSDNTVPLNTYKEMKKELGFRLNHCSLTIYYNTIEKDYGVRKEQIKLKKFILQEK